MVKHFNAALILEYIPKILTSIGVTFEFLILSLAFGSLLGALLAKGKLSRHKAAAVIANGYTTVIRSTPTLILLFVIYYGIPKLLKAFDLNARSISLMLYVVVSFTLISAAELSEVMRASYEAVPKGQREAGVSIGMTEWQTFYRILVPQALRIAVPNLGNTVILLFKEGSIAYSIGLIDIMGKANLINSNSLGAHVLEVYLAVSLIYWGISVLFEQIIKLYEQHILRTGTLTKKGR